MVESEPRTRHNRYRIRPFVQLHETRRPSVDTAYRRPLVAREDSQPEHACIESKRLLETGCLQMHRPKRQRRQQSKSCWRRAIAVRGGRLRLSGTSKNILLIERRR